jgi:hypothetical protein
LRDRLSAMKTNSTVFLTLLLLIMMLGAGSVSALLGFEMGSSALKGITTPDARPTSKIPGSRANNSQQLGVELLKEDEILKIVQARIEGKTKAAKSEKLEEYDEEARNTRQKPKERTPAEVLEPLQPGFPVVAESEGVTFAVQSVRYSGGDLLMRVNMQNQGKNSVRFLYSFLDVIDDRGRRLSATTEGLPQELPAESEIFSGTLVIPTALLDDVNKISLSLTDYPAQRLKLDVLNIPVER